MMSVRVFLSRVRPVSVLTTIGTLLIIPQQNSFAATCTNSYFLIQRSRLKYISRCISLLTNDFQRFAYSSYSIVDMYFALVDTDEPGSIYFILPLSSDVLLMILTSIEISTNDLVSYLSTVIFW